MDSQRVVLKGGMQVGKQHENKTYLELMKKHEEVRFLRLMIAGMLRDKGESYKAIGRTFNVSANRIRKLMTDMERQFRMEKYNDY